MQLCALQLLLIATNLPSLASSSRAAAASTSSSRISSVGGEFALTYSDRWRDEMRERMTTFARQHDLVLEQVSISAVDRFGASVQHGESVDAERFPLQLKLGSGTEDVSAPSGKPPGFELEYSTGWKEDFAREVQAWGSHHRLSPDHFDLAVFSGAGARIEPGREPSQEDFPITVKFLPKSLLHAPTPSPQIFRLEYSDDWTGEFAKLLQAFSSKHELMPDQVDISVSTAQGEETEKGRDLTPDQFPLQISLTPKYVRVDRPKEVKGQPARRKRRRRKTQKTQAEL